MESAAISPTSVNPDKEFMTEYQRTCITQETDGSYTARFPWKPNHPPLPSNFTLCEGRTRALAHRLAASPSLLTTYNNILIDQERRGFIEKINSPVANSYSHYIPHHAVKKESVTTPIRIVYDCSCHQSKTLPSLNDCLQIGAPFLQDLCLIIVRFRLYRFAISTDIEKAFLHVNLHKDDRDFTRFLWLSNPSDPDSEFVVYRFKVVLFGATCSPFMLNSVMHYHLSHYTSPIAQDMLNSLYVDNIISGCDTEENTLEYYTTARAIMQDAKFNLRSWASNSQLLTVKATNENTAADSTEVNILGIRWNTVNDTLSLITRTPIPKHTSLVTKREVLRESSGIFDPLGLISPVTVKSKIFIQHLWQQQLHWDEPLNQSDQDEWLTITKEIREATSICIIRRYFTSEDNQLLYQLHVFSDASTKTYGAVAFICNGSRTRFIMAKTRVAPLKQLSLPKLELMGALTGAQLCSFIANTIKLCPSVIHLWTDSQIVLYWLHSEKKLNQFVSHRVSEIHHLTTTSSWQYCPTADNPADLHRGITSAQLQSSKLWHSGPQWITTRDNWPVWQPSATLHLQAAAIKTSRFVPVTTSPGLGQIMDLSNYSTLNKVLGVTAYVLRSVSNVKNKLNKTTGPLRATELHTAEMSWVKDCQKQVYYNEITNMRSYPSAAKRLPLVRQLRLFIDDEGFIRCGGRIHNAPLYQATRFPYLLPPRHTFTSMIIYSTHIKLFHSGTNSTLTAIRQTFWIPKARQRIKSLLHRCTTCRRHSGKPYPLPTPPPLPAMRMCDVAPFIVTGVDFSGALYVQMNGAESKVYICLFTCATTRAIHLEIVTNLSTETFLLAFRRFVSRKSLPRIIVSDNGSTYLSAAEELKELLPSRSLMESLSRHGVIWKFIPKRAPWYGGWWERSIGLTKSALKKTLGRAHVSLIVLETLVTEIGAVLNDRSLTYTPSELEEMEPLTPAHLLYGRRVTLLPYESVNEEELEDPNFGDSSSIKRRAKQQALTLQHFRSRWRHEYLTSLREYHKTTGTDTQKVNVGDVDLIQDDTPRIDWQLAVIEELIIGNDGFVRAAHIRTAQGRTNRPISKLCPLEVSSNEESQTESVEPVLPNLETSTVTEGDNPCPSDVPRRRLKSESHPG